MLLYIVRRILMMIPTLRDHQRADLHHHQAAARATISRRYIAELQAQGETVDNAQHRVPAQAVRLRPAAGRALLHLGRRACCAGDFGYSFEYELPVTRRRRRPAVADHHRLVRRRSSSPGSIAFPIGIYSATHQYSWGDYGLTFLGLLGLATPNFLLALVLMYLANVWFGTSIGGLMDPGVSSTSR